MHEMSIVINILDIAQQQAQLADAHKVNSIEVEIGQLAGIEVDSLEFCFEVARRDYELASEAELVIHRIEGLGFCHKCDKEVEVDFHIALCPDCGQGIKITRGQEMKVRSLNVD